MLSAAIYLLVTAQLSVLSHARMKDVEVQEDSDLHCPPCRKVHCWPRKLSNLNCKGGLTLGVCNCCPVCAKIIGESCGGQWNYLGKCDSFLYCEPQKSVLYTYKTEDVEKSFVLTKGVCKKGTPQLSSDQAYTTFCRPKCTSEYCIKNPKSICSAIDNAEEAQECQGRCQHTSCRACRFVRKEDVCTKCSHDDFRCMQKFGKCIKQKFCKKKEFPCRIGKEIENKKWEFQCKVPECIVTSQNTSIGKE